MYKLVFDEKKVIEEYNSGISSRKLSIRYKCNVKTIIRLLKRNGIKLTQVYRLKIDWIKVYEEYKNGKTVLELSKMYSCAKMTVLRNFYKRGFKLRTPKEFFIDETRHGSWKGGIFKYSKSLRQKIYTSLEYKIWRNEVYRRDNYTCQRCDIRSKNLQAHHVKKVKDIISDNNIVLFEDAIECKELWDVNNGLTCCKDCHKYLES